MNKKLTILWLDDQRDPSTYFKVKKPQSSVWVRNNDFYQNNIFSKYDVNFIWVKSFDEFANYIENNGVPKFISFDNDLKNGRMTVDGEVPNGEDCVKWLINYCNDNKLKLPKYYLHTANHKQRDILNKLLKENVKMKKVVLNESKIKKIVRECLLNVLKETKMYGYEIPGNGEDAEVEFDNIRRIVPASSYEMMHFDDDDYENDDTEYDGFDYDAPENAGEKEYDMEHDRKNFGNHNIYNDNGKASMDKLRSLEMNE